MNNKIIYLKRSGSGCVITFLGQIVGNNSSKK